MTQALDAATTDLLALPPLFGLELAAKPLDVSRATVYALARRGELPIPVVHVGSRMKVRRCDLLKYLGIADPAAAPAA